VRACGEDEPAGGEASVSTAIDPAWHRAQDALLEQALPQTVSDAELSDDDAVVFRPRSRFSQTCVLVEAKIDHRRLISGSFRKSTTARGRKRDSTLIIGALTR
jgi:hypothetical protein